GSAGGHLALLAAYTPNDPTFDPLDLRGLDTSVRAVVGYYAPTDLYELYAYGERTYDDHHPGKSLLVESLRLIDVVGPEDDFVPPVDLMRILIGDVPENAPERYHTASPLFHAGPHCPPTLLLHGQHDCLVPVTQSRVLRNALLKHGVEVVLVEYPYTEHGFDLALPDISPAAQASFYDVERFLALMV
ncbi:MAG: alpha/beta hydrolase, partial [Anaerolineae bacterium]|nr:alpha/beta hydrolase [Anaerolineae bacterium]